MRAQGCACCASFKRNKPITSYTLHSCKCARQRLHNILQGAPGRTPLSVPGQRAAWHDIDTARHQQPNCWTATTLRIVQYTPKMRSTTCRHIGQGVPTRTIGAHSLHRHLCTLVSCSRPTSRGADRQMTHRSASDPPTNESAPLLPEAASAAAAPAGAADGADGGADGTPPSDKRAGSDSNPGCGCGCGCGSGCGAPPVLMTPCVLNGLSEAGEDPCINGLSCCCCCCG